MSQVAPDAGRVWLLAVEGTWFERHWLAVVITTVVTAAFVLIAMAYRQHRLTRALLEQVKHLRDAKSEARRRTAAHQLAREDLQIAEQVYEALKARSPLAVFIIDAAGRYVSVNHAASALLGIPEDRLLGMSHSDVIARDQLDRAGADAERTRSGEWVKAVYTFRRGDGALVEAEVHSATLHDGRAICIATDVTEARRQDERSRVELGVVTSVLDGLPMRMVVAGLDGRAIWMNRRWRLEKPASGDNLLTAVDVLAAQGMAWAATIASSYRAVASGVRENAVDEYAEPGTGRWLRSYIARVDGPSGPLVVLSCEDVTDQRAALSSRDEERRFVSAVIETVACLVLVIDREGRIVRFNQACSALTGWAPEDVVGRHFGMLIPAEHRGAMIEEFGSVVGSGAVRPLEQELETRGGARRLVNWSNAVLRDPEGRVEYVIATGIDITDRKRLETELVQAQRMESVGLLAGGIAHDFNNLLTAIFGHIGLAKRAIGPTHPASDSLERVEQAADQAGRVVKSLLTFARREHAEKRPERIATVVSDTVRLVQGTLPATIRLVWRACPQDVWVTCDRHQIEQSLLNLVFNARDAMPTGGTISIVARDIPAPEGVESPTGRAVSISVTDTGVGMPREVLARLFEPFFTTKPRGEGTGLGLPIVRSIAQDHGGIVRVSSQHGQGATVEIVFPRGEPGETTPSVVRARGDRVLICGPRPYARRIIASSLRAAGFSVEESSDAPPGVMPEAERPSLIVVDLSNGDDGWSGYAHRLVAVEPPLAVIVLLAAEGAFEFTSERVEVVHEPLVMASLVRAAHRLVSGERSVGTFRDE
ncbi:MAG: PAS domain S-box protein [Phycisphaeraceae bacterium]|nr:MAG: PAS domain S-box protein [Phycisphaeraceae bacterium]